MLVFVGLQSEFVNDSVYQSFLYVCRKCLDGRIEFQVLVHIQTLEDAILLWAVADPVPNQVEVSLYITAQDANLAACWLYCMCQTFESGALACTVDTKKGKALTVIDSKGGSLNGKNWS